MLGHSTSWVESKLPLVSAGSIKQTYAPTLRTSSTAKRSTRRPERDKNPLPVRHVKMLNTQNPTAPDELNTAGTPVQADPGRPSVQLIENRTLSAVHLDYDGLPVAGRNPPAQAAEPAVNHEAALSRVASEDAAQTPRITPTIAAHQ